MKNSIFLQFLFFAVGLLIISSCGSERKVENTYTNPVIAGDLPDPSIIRVGETYYAAGTSNDFAPNYPIYESKDLINWTRIGAVFNEPPAWSSEDFWAPELFYNNGTFFVYYTTKRKDNHIACIGVATTKDIHQGFTDHGIIIEWGEEAIDAFVFKDDDGQLYISWKAYGLTPGREIEILASELSDDGLSLVGDHWTLTDHTKGWKGSGDEGQCLVKRNGYYYLLYSIGGCCDSRCDYRVVVSRSKDIRAGWEQLPEPLLQGGENWRCPGHGTLVSTPDNRDFYLYHSYNATDFMYIGRQAMLDELVWDTDTGWPHFKNGNTPSDSATVPISGTEQIQHKLWSDDFATDKNLGFFEWDVNVPKPMADIDKGEILLTSTHSGVSFLGLRPKRGDYSMQTVIIPSQQPAGIGVYSNQDNVLAYLVNQNELVLFQIDHGQKTEIAKEEIEHFASLNLKYESTDGRHYRFYWSEDQSSWHPFGDEVDAGFIAQWGFSPRVGFILDGQGSATAKFSSLRIEYQE